MTAAALPMRLDGERCGAHGVRRGGGSAMVQLGADAWWLLVAAVCVAGQRRGCHGCCYWFFSGERD